MMDKIAIVGAAVFAISFVTAFVAGIAAIWEDGEFYSKIALTSIVVMLAAVLVAQVAAGGNP